MAFHHSHQPPKTQPAVISRSQHHYRGWQARGHWRAIERRFSGRGLLWPLADQANPTGQAIPQPFFGGVSRGPRCMFGPKTDTWIIMKPGCFLTDGKMVKDWWARPTPRARPSLPQPPPECHCWNRQVGTKYSDYASPKEPGTP